MLIFQGLPGKDRAGSPGCTEASGGPSEAPGGPQPPKKEKEAMRSSGGPEASEAAVGPRHISPPPEPREHCCMASV